MSSKLSFVTKSKKLSKAPNYLKNTKNNMYASCLEGHVHPLKNQQMQNIAAHTCTADDLDLRVMYVRGKQQRTLLIVFQEVTCPIKTTIRRYIDRLNLHPELAEYYRESEFQRIELYIREYLLTVLAADLIKGFKRCVIPDPAPKLSEQVSSVAVEIINLRSFLVDSVTSLWVPPPPLARPNLSINIRRAFSVDDLNLPPYVIPAVHVENAEEVVAPIQIPANDNVATAAQSAEENSDNVFDTTDGDDDDVFDLNAESLNKTFHDLNVILSENDVRIINSTRRELSVNLTRCDSNKSELKSPDEGVPEAKRHEPEVLSKPPKSVTFHFAEGELPPHRLVTTDEPLPFTLESMLAQLKANSNSAPSTSYLVPPVIASSSDHIFVRPPSTDAENEKCNDKSENSSDNKKLADSNDVGNSVTDKPSNSNDQQSIEIPVEVPAVIPAEVPAMIPAAIQVAPPDDRAYLRVTFPRFNYAEIDGKQYFARDLIDSDQIPEQTFQQYVPAFFPRDYYRMPFEWDQPDSYLRLWNGLNRGTTVNYHIVVPIYSRYVRRQTFEWPRTRTEALCWRNHLNFVRKTAHEEIFPHNHVDFPRWSYVHRNLPINHLITILGNVGGQELEIIFDATLPVCLISQAAVDNLAPFVDLHFEELQHPRAIYVPWKDFVRVVSRKTTALPIRLTPNIHHHVEEEHVFNCYVADFPVSRCRDPKLGTIILGRQLTSHIVRYDPVKLDMSIMGPEENRRNRSIRCKEKAPEIRIRGLMKTLREANPVDIETEFKPVRQFCIEKTKGCRYDEDYVDF
ncbi:uncharacterized protein LOC135847716 [Planococcus citri]|uniref:uncharacterized protein LOC135847716 n=1 Tax=Planococcus citri TaxID=170843 RepID=UPI0031F7EEA9